MAGRACAGGAGLTSVEETAVPISFHIDTARRLVRTRVWGRIRDEHVRDLYRHLVADPRFRPDFRQLTTLDDNVQFTLHPGLIAEVTARQVFKAGTRRAVVAHTAAALDFAHMFSFHAEREGQLVRVFHDEAAAERWIFSPLVDSMVSTDTHEPRATA
jgi:hypothetical protein